MTARIREFVDAVRERFPEAVEESSHVLGSDRMVVRREDLVGVCEFLRDAFGFTLLADLSGTDWGEGDQRFHVNLQLYAFDTNHRLQVKVRLPEDDPRLPSVSGVWPTAVWHEREVYDFFGVTFEGHPDLRRIFMPDGWVGHPLRKDYPVGGVPVEYRIEPAYVGDRVVSPTARPSAGGIPARLAQDRGKKSLWTWTGPPASGVRIPDPERRRSKDEHPEPPRGDDEG